MCLLIKGIKNGLMLNKIALAISGIMEYIEDYKISKQYNDLYKAAWVASTYLIDKLDQCHMQMNATIRLSVNGKLMTMYYGEAIHRSIGKLAEIVDKLPPEIDAQIADIMEKKDAFYTINNKMSKNVKKRYKNNFNFVKYQYDR